MAFHFRNRKREVPGLNTTSTADISFMLLIFFLVTTSMDIDKGLQRQLPPPRPPKEQMVESQVPKGTMVEVAISPRDSITVDGRPATLADVERGMIDVIGRAGNRHVVKLTVSRQSNYDTYFHVENTIVNTYRQLRNGRARRLYGHQLADCTPEQQKRVMDMIPQRILETYGEGEAPTK